MAVKRKKRRKSGWKFQVLLIVSILTSIVFSAIAIILAVGMIPTVVAAIVDKTEGKMRTMTVGAINFAGCTPFMIDVFKQGNSIETAITYIVQPQTIVVMYFAAGMGYTIDWAMTGIVSSLMVQKGKKRRKDIIKAQKDLVDRWGPEVTGTLTLDEYGFPKDSVAMQKAEE